MANGWVMPAASSALMTGALTPSSWNDFDTLFDSLITSRFETQLTSNNLKRRNEKLDLHGAGRPPCTHGSSLRRSRAAATRNPTAIPVTAAIVWALSTSIHLRNPQAAR